MADATNVGNVYLAIRADIKRLSSDLAQAEKTAKAGAEKIQQTIDKGMDFEKAKAKIVGAAAAIYAAFRTIGMVTQQMQLGATLQKQEQAFSALAMSAGTNAEKILASVKGLSRGMVAEADLMKASGQAMMMGIPADKIASMMKIAEATSRQTGQSVTDAFADITLGVARQSRMILDNLGIIVDVDKANQKYADSLGKTAAALTDAEKKQAFMNAVLQAGNELVSRIGESRSDVDGINRLMAAMGNLTNEVAKAVNKELNPAFSATATIVEKIAQGMKNMRTGVEDMSSAAIDTQISKTKNALANPELTGANRKYMEDRLAMLERQRGVFAGGAAESYRLLQKQGRPYNPTMKDFVGSEEARRSWNYRQDSSIIDTSYLDVQDKGSERNQATIFGPSWADYDDGLKVDMKAWEQMKKQHDTQQQELIDQNEKTWEILARNQNADIASAVQELEKQHKKMIDLSQHTAEAMQDAMADLFFDAMTGKLRTLEDYFNAFYQSIAKMASQYLSQQGMGMLMKAVGSMGGGGSAADLPINTLANQPFHSGGIVGITGGAMRSIPASYYSTAPRLHSGLMPDEYPAILQKGEAVIPKGGSMGGGGGDTYYISAMDTKSIVDALRRSGAVPMLSEENIRGNGPLRRAIQTRAR